MIIENRVKAIVLGHIMLEREVSMKKFLATFLASLCILGTSMVAFAGTDAAQSVPGCTCGGTGVYSHSIEVFGKTYTHDHKVGDRFVSCDVTVKGYDDIYYCDRCSAKLHGSHTEETHTY